MTSPWPPRRPPPPPPPRSPRRPAPQPSRRPSDDFVTRLHNTSLNAPPSELARLSRHDFALEDSQANADSSSSESDIHPSRPRRRPAHSRSMSVPFPSLFSSKKKQRPGPVHDDDSDDSHNDPPVTRSAAKTHTRGNMSQGNRDFATGNCMTCNSLVRWPRDLKVFKCTVCVTVNDLSPEEHAGHRSGGVPQWLRGAKPATSSSSSPPDQPARSVDKSGTKEISLEHTKSLVHSCLQEYLVQVVRQGKAAEKLRGLSSGRPHSPVDQDDHSIGHWKATNPTTPNSVSQRTQKEEPATYMFSEQPTLRQSHHQQSPRSYSSSYPARPLVHSIFGEESIRPAAPLQPEIDGKRLFKPLEDYLVSCFSSLQCVNSSFLPSRPHYTARPESDDSQPVFPTQSTGNATRPVFAPEPKGGNVRRQTAVPRSDPRCAESQSQLVDLDPKLLLLGNFAENGMWWTGNQRESQQHAQSKGRKTSEAAHSVVSMRCPQIEWDQVASWYATLLNAAESWTAIYNSLYQEEAFEPLSAAALQDLEDVLLAAQERVQRVLLKVTEMLLKRPGRALTDPEDMRFLLILLENPLLYAIPSYYRGSKQSGTGGSRGGKNGSDSTHARGGPISGQHSGVIKRILGLMSNASNSCHTHLIAWFARYPESRFSIIKDLTSGFLTFRLIRQNEKKYEAKVDVIDGLIPNMSTGRSAASLHAALGTSSSSKKKPKEQPKKMVYHDDWQIRAAARVLALLFAANNTLGVRRADATMLGNSSVVLREGVQVFGQVLPTSDFYNSMIDYADLIADFEAWETKRSKFAFCQYPFLLSIWAKSQILEYDARRQMTTKARDAFFDSIMTRKNVTQHLTLDVRRDCLVEDSLAAVSEVIGSGGEDIKKRLRIEFRGEEGYDAGGLRKEWFLLLVREVFNPEHGLFTYDEESQLCYFNPNSFETSDQFFLVGVVIGLAIYNSTILDVALPPFAYRKLLAAAPISSIPSSAHPRPVMTYNLEDLAEWRPRLAAGLKQLLDYDGDVEETFGLDFVVPVEKYGTVLQVPLCPGGEWKSVTNANRREFVDCYVRYLLDHAVTRQFEPFKRGFYTVCGGNALSLFRPEEIELLVRGSDTALDIDSLRAAAEYDNWGTKNPDGTEPVIGWFWDTFKSAKPSEQRKLLSFITGSDRIPAMGAALLPIKISCLGEDEERYPIARTCFNMLSLRRYGSQERLEHMLWTAVHESEGFGLK
ncbi:hypothetical protein VDGD_01943 [Verticillium dahliae]|nr:Glutathione-independent formaldehyde dehydrogenase [Verticillium dahliae VDG1]RBQ94270.1 hypothetical protein VDGD_01943 [Verticillium dahliae]